MTDPTTQTGCRRERARAEVLSRIINRGVPTADEVRVLCEAAEADPVERELIALAGRPVVDSIAQRLLLFGSVRDAVVDIAIQDGLTIRDAILWSQNLPLASAMLAWRHAGDCTLIGLTGAPGAGKTSLVKILCAAAKLLSGRESLGVSLDDFYLTPQERQSRGFKWRGGPGTHDVKLLAQFVEQFKSDARDRLVIPQYDRDGERRIEPRVVEAFPRLVIVEGWWLGASAPGYDVLNEALDGLFYLDLDIELAHRWRIEREAAIHEKSGGKRGMNARQAEEFWLESLLPGIEGLLLPLKERADVVLEIDEERVIRSIRRRNVR